MKKITNIILATTLTGLIALASCKKYEEGPSISLRTKKARLAGSWVIDKVTQNGTDVTNQYTAGNPKWAMEKDGKYTFSATVLGTQFSDAGTWEFISDKEEVTMLSNQTGSTRDTIVILKLKNKEFWYKDKTDPDKVVFQLKAE